jgi:hypothetical protein
MCFVEKVGFEPRTLGIPSLALCQLRYEPGSVLQHSYKGWTAQVDELGREKSSGEERRGEERIEEGRTGA